mgnify:CR=1 FL=1
MKTETSVVVEKYKDSIFSAAFNVCANAADAEDVVQDTFIRYHTTNTQFADEQHIRAWLLRVAINKAKNVTMSFWRRRGVPLEDYAETLAFPSPEAGGLFEKVMKLPEKYRTAIYLYYYEDYSTDEIARLTGTPAATVRTRLRRGRELLRAGLEEAKSNV